MEDLGHAFEFTFSRRGSIAEKTLTPIEQLSRDLEYRFADGPETPVPINVVARSLSEATKKVESLYPDALIASARCIAEELKG